MKEGTAPAEQPPTGWRFRLGILFFVLWLVCPVFIPLVYLTGLTASWKTILSGLLVLGIPQACGLLAVILLGKEGFNYLKGRLFGLFKKLAPPDRVSRTRYRIGLVLFVIPLFFGWLAPYAPEWIPGYEENRFIINAAGDVMFFTSLFVLGGDFWDKVRALFLHEAKVQIPGQ